MNDQADTPRILVVKLSALGDLFRPLPAIHAIKTALGARIDWVTADAYGDLVACFDDVDRVIPFYRRAFFGHLPQFLAELRRERYDLVLDFQGLLKSALVTRMARGKRRVGPSYRREGARLFYSEAAEGPGIAERHAVDVCLDTARHLGVPVDDLAFPVTFPAVHPDAPHPRVGLLPVSRWVTKDWPLHHYADLGKRLLSSGSITLYLLGGPEDRAVCARLAALIGEGVVNTCGRMDLVQSGGLMASLDLLVANDSGPLHMAAACGTPCLSPFGPTDPVRTGPYGPGHRVLTADVDCRPCFSRSCALPGQICMRDITPGRMYEVAMEMLSHGPEV
jgi:heptosyltransferase-1